MPWDDAILVSADKLRKLWDSLSEMRSSLCKRRLERTILRPALLPVKTAQFTQFFRQVWRYSKIAHINCECIGRFRISVQLFQSTLLTAEASRLVAGLSLQRPCFGAVPVCVGGLCSGQNGHVKGLTLRTSTFIRRAQVKVGLINLCKGLFSLSARIYYKLKSGT
jgi:hypothetical protein